jgi:hypothetical protein
MSYVQYEVCQQPQAKRSQENSEWTSKGRQPQGSVGRSSLQILIDKSPAEEFTCRRIDLLHDFKKAEWSILTPSLTKKGTNQ